MKKKTVEVTTDPYWEVYGGHSSDLPTETGEILMRAASRELTLNTT
jgi:hypothetical protein